MDQTLDQELQNVLYLMSWRDVFSLLSIITVFASLCLWFVLPEHHSSAEKKPDLNKMYKRAFLLANAKGNYYDSIASIHEGDYVNAKRIILPFITLR